MAIGSPIAAIARWLYNAVLPFGAPGIFALALIDSGLIPIPQGVDILLFAEILHDPGAAWLSAGLATAGSLLGTIFLYFLSRKAGEVALRRHASPYRIEQFRETFEKYEALTLVLPTMVPLPLPMKVCVIAAGAFRVHFGRFVLAILFARVVRFFAIAALAYAFGEAAWAFLRQHLAPAALVVAVLLAAFYEASRRWATRHS